jgi:molybdopterin synthase sulfur carrier subunit
MIKVLFFGQLKEQLGVAGTEVSIEFNVTVSQLLEGMIHTHPHWAHDLNNETLLVAVDQIMAKAETVVSRSSEVAFFPPVTGG